MALARGMPVVVGIQADNHATGAPTP
jgi:hypothetical protein